MFAEREGLSVIGNPPRLLHKPKPVHEQSHAHVTKDWAPRAANKRLELKEEAESDTRRSCATSVSGIQYMSQVLPIL